MKKGFIIVAILASILLVNFDGITWAYEIDPLSDPVFGFQQTSQYGMIILMFYGQMDLVFFDLMLTDLWKEYWKAQLALGNSGFFEPELEALLLSEFDNIVNAEDLSAFLGQNGMDYPNLFTPQGQWKYAEELYELDTASAVPEPSTYMMMGIGLLAIIVVARRKKARLVKS